jgi:hypothetical protein
MNCQLNAGGTTLSADSFRSDWPTTVPAGQSTRGTIVFNGRPEASAIRTTLSFATVYGDFAPPSISVPDILLRDLMSQSGEHGLVGGEIVAGPASAGGLAARAHSG